jgi:hypothetical protein
MSGIVAELAKWDSFYVIVGSAAGALIGLQFVVMTLIAASPPLRAADAGAAFGTPTIVHFGAAFLLSAILRAPWESSVPIGITWAVIGFSGVVYSVIVGQRMRRQDVYRPEFEDWLFHLVLPLMTYLIVTLSPFAASSHMREALFAIGGATLMLLFIGIHNSWDAVAYHVFVKLAEPHSEPQRKESSKKRR